MQLPLVVISAVMYQYFPTLCS